VLASILLWNRILTVEHATCRPPSAHAPLQTRRSPKLRTKRISHGPPSRGARAVGSTALPRSANIDARDKGDEARQAKVLTGDEAPFPLSSPDHIAAGHLAGSPGPRRAMIQERSR
jgi:hypothetical protein